MGDDERGEFLKVRRRLCIVLCGPVEKYPELGLLERSVVLWLVELWLRPTLLLPCFTFSGLFRFSWDIPWEMEVVLHAPAL